MLFEGDLRSHDFVFALLHGQLRKTPMRSRMRLNRHAAARELAQVVPVAYRFIGFDASIEVVTPPDVIGRHEQHRRHLESCEQRQRHSRIEL